MKFSHTALIGGTLFLAAHSQAQQMSGQSHPENVDEGVVTTSPEPATPVVVKQTVVVNPAPTSVAAQQGEVYQAYKPYVPPGGKPLESRAIAVAPDIDAGVVTSYDYQPNAVAEGTLIKARLAGTLSTQTSHVGQHFVATLSAPVQHNGRIIIPQGASLEGRVTKIKSGSRISGGAAMHLEPETITLPDGTMFHINARVSDVDWGRGSHVNDEGTIVGGNHVTGHAVTLAATTGGGAITGAVLGGGVGAAVGAGIGAGVGTVLWLKQDREQTLPEGVELIFSLNRPMELRPFAQATGGR